MDSERWSGGLRIGLVVMAVLVGCRRGDGGQQAGGEPSAGQSTEASESGQQKAEQNDEAAEQASGDDEDTRDEKLSKSEWREKVRRSARKARADTGGDDGKSGEPCSFFPDSCEGDDEACFSTADGRPRCATINASKRPGDRCRTADDCNRNQQCVGGRPGTCRRMCKPGARGKWGCGSGAACVRVQDRRGEAYPWGVCHAIEDTCTPWPEDNCGFGENCFPTPVGRRCQSYAESAEVGDRCPNGPRDCNFGQACVRVEGGYECRDRCDEAHRCGVGSCEPLVDRYGGYCAGGWEGEGPPRRAKPKPDRSDEIRGY